MLSVGLNGGAITTIASGQDDPWSVAVSSTNVYWTNYGSGGVGAVMAADVNGATSRRSRRGSSFR